MKRSYLIFLLITMFFAVSCGEINFNNPNDKNSDAYQGGGDAGRPDDDAEIPSGRNRGELYGECYPNKTCNEGLECDELNNICIKNDSGDSSDSGDSGDSGSPSCKLDAAYTAIDAERYFTFKGIGKINDASLNNDLEWANMVTVTLAGIEGKDLDYADSYSFFMESTDQDQPGVMLEALGDLETSTGRVTTIVLATVPKYYLDYMHENDIDHLDQAPVVRVYDIAVSNDEASYRQCIIAANKVDESSQIELGKMQVCHDKNIDFSVGETFKLSMAAELEVGEELLDLYPDADTMADLCTCFDMNATEDNEVDCATIDWGDVEEPVLTDEEKCYEAGGTYYDYWEGELTCYRIVDCAPKPANTEWSGAYSYFEYYDYDSDTWTDYDVSHSTEYDYNGEAQTCQFICTEGFDWNGFACTSVSYLTLGNICTGQTSCYSTSSSMICPSSSSADFYGQDAQYTGKCAAQSFTSSSNVVVDNNTGLTWEKSPSSSTYTWENRNTHCNELNSSNYGGINTWRVPTPLELLTIVNNSTYNPATNSNFTGMPTSDYSTFWTSKEYGDSGFSFSSYDGNVDFDPKTSTYKVLCVSGNEMPKGVFTPQTISSQVVVNDSTTGLMWQKEYVTGKTWQQALKYCEDLTYSGYSDWRLPNKNELASILNYDKSGTPYSDFPDMPNSWFWSSSTRANYTDGAWSVAFFAGAVHSHSDKTDSDPYVRCVR